MGGSSTKVSTKTSTQPTIPKWIDSAAQNNFSYYNSLSRNPTDYITRNNQNLTEAWHNAGQADPGMAAFQNLTGWQGQQVNPSFVDPTNVSMVNPSMVDPTNVSMVNPSMVDNPSMAEASLIDPSLVAGGDYSQYMNPFNRDVIQTTMDQFLHGNDMAINQLRSGAGGGSNAFGSRQGVAEGVMSGETMRNMAQMIAGLNSANFGQAQAALSQDTDRRNIAMRGNQDATNAVRSNNQSAANAALFGNQSATNAARSVNAATTNAALFGNQAAANAASSANSSAAQAAAMTRLAGAGDWSRASRENIAQQTAAGQQQYAQEQGQNPAAISGQVAQALSSLYGIPMSAFFGSEGTGESNEKKKASLADSLGTVMMGLGKMGVRFPTSDRRLKRNARLLGEDEHGNRWWSFHYIWDNGDQPLRTGVMSDEAPREAVVVDEYGFDTVDYSKLRGAA